MNHFAHIINPFRAPETSDLFLAQPITFKTMTTAHQVAKAHDIDVKLLSAQYKEDRDFVPSEFFKTRDLNRSILDLGTFEDPQRKLPLLKDVLDRMWEATKAEWMIYTNVDIGLLPHFYLVVNHLIDQGYEAFCINNRTVSENYTLDDLPMIWSDVGEPHKGYDCFVFGRDIYRSRYELDKVCIGIPRIGSLLRSNMAFHSTKKAKTFKDIHATFHIGKEGGWARDDDSIQSDYKDFNRQAELRALHILAQSDFKAKPIIRRELLRSLGLL